MANTADRTIRNDALTRLISNVGNNSEETGKTFSLEGDHYAKIVAVSPTIKSPMQYDTVYSELGNDNPNNYVRIYFSIGSTNISEPSSPDACVALPPEFEAVEKANLSGRDGSINYIQPRASKLTKSRAALVHTANQHTCIVDMSLNPAWEPVAGDRIVAAFDNVHRNGQVYMQEPVFQRLHEKGYDNVPPTIGQKVSNAFNKMENVVATNTDPCINPNNADLGANQATFYTTANRGPAEIKKIVLHSTDGGSGDGRAQKTIKRFADPSGPTLAYKWTNPNTGETKTNPPCDEVMANGGLPAGTICHPYRKRVEKTAKTSVHYAVDQGGNVVQGVLDKDVAHHAGSGLNRESIGIEMNGKPNQGPGQGFGGLYAKMYNDKLIGAAVELVAKLSAQYNIPIDREHIIGHYEFYPSRRFDPGNDAGWSKRGYGAGNYFNWDDFLARVRSIAANICPTTV